MLRSRSISILVFLTVAVFGLTLSACGSHPNDHLHSNQTPEKHNENSQSGWVKVRCMSPNLADGICQDMYLPEKDKVTHVIAMSQMGKSCDEEEKCPLNNLHGICDMTDRRDGSIQSLKYYRSQNLSHSAETNCRALGGKFTRF